MGRVLLILLSLLWLPGPVSAADSQRLDVSLAVLDPGIPSDPTQHKKLGIFPQIREMESRYVPVALRRALLESNQWGPIRVQPEADPTSEVLVTGSILQSNGISLAISLQVSDSSGRQWLDNIYTETSTDARDAGIPPRNGAPFQQLYERVAADMVTVAQQLTTQDIDAIENISQLRYAQGLSPEAFGDYLTAATDGSFTLKRLPARDDPMLARIERLRQQEYIFIDTLDDQYASLFKQMAPTYDLWRQYNREQVLYQQAREAQLAERSKPRRGSYQAMKQTYLNFRWAKIQQQESHKLAQGFNNEVSPTFMQLRGRVVELSGSLQDQYQEWRRILRAIFALETAGPA